jgi:Raf kinase inhibitor-like YbhB/YbcL family protein
MKRFALCVMLPTLFTFSACGHPPPGGQGGAGGSSGTAGSAAGGTAGTSGSGGSAGAAAFAVTSSAFAEGATIPEKHQCTAITGGQNISPALSWTAGPAGTQSYAVVMRDTGLNLVHWAVWDIPGSVLGLPENIEAAFQPAVPAGAKQVGLNPNLAGYFGPCSPSTVNTYQFTVYAMPAASIPSLSQQSTSAEAAQAITGAALASVAVSGQS